MSITELERQLEAVQREAFAAGYAAAMEEVKELTTQRAAPDARDAAVPSDEGHGSGRGHGRTRTRQAAPTSRPARSRRRPRTSGIAAGRAARAGRTAARRPRRGTNAVLVSEVLKSAAPRTLREAEIHRALQDRGRTVSFPSISYSLR